MLCDGVRFCLPQQVYMLLRRGIKCIFSGEDCPSFREIIDVVLKTGAYIAILFEDEVYNYMVDVGVGYSHGKLIVDRSLWLVEDAGEAERLIKNGIWFQTMLSPSEEMFEFYPEPLFTLKYETNIYVNIGGTTFETNPENLDKLYNLNILDPGWRVRNDDIILVAHDDILVLCTTTSPGCSLLERLDDHEYIPFAELTPVDKNGEYIFKLKFVGDVDCIPRFALEPLIV